MDNETLILTRILMLEAKMEVNYEFLKLYQQKITSLKIQIDELEKTRTLIETYNECK